MVRVRDLKVRETSVGASSWEAILAIHPLDETKLKMDVRQFVNQRRLLLYISVPLKVVI